MRTNERTTTEEWRATTFGQPETVHSTGVAALDSLFTGHGIPCGQLIEITGPPSSGKTSLLHMILAGTTNRNTAAYIDLHHSFFPASAEFYGVDLARLLIVRPDNGPSATRAAEILLQHHKINRVLIDLIGETRSLPLALIHRLRIQTVRNKALTIFLTESNSDIIPASTVSARLTVRRLDRSRIEIEVTKSRICREGLKTEVLLYE